MKNLTTLAIAALAWLSLNTASHADGPPVIDLLASPTLGVNSRFTEANHTFASGFSTDRSYALVDSVTVRLSNPDSIDHTFTVTVRYPNPLYQPQSDFPGSISLTFPTITVPAGAVVGDYTTTLAVPNYIWSGPNVVMFVAVARNESVVSAAPTWETTSVSNQPAGQAFSAVKRTGLHSGPTGWVSSINPGSINSFSIQGTVFRLPPDRVAKDSQFQGMVGNFYSTLFPPAINGSGVLAFRAKVKNSSSVTSDVIVRRNEDSTMVARGLTTAPGTTGQFKSFGDPVINSAGEIAFNASLLFAGTVTKTNDYGVWSDLGGTLSLALREGDPAPGAQAGQMFAAVQWFNLQDGALYLGATTTDGALTGAIKGSGVWKWDGTTLSKVVIVGDTIVGWKSIHTANVRSISKPASSGNGNATSRLVGSDGTIALLLTSVNGDIEVFTF